MVYPENMLANLEKMRGLVMSEHVMLALVRKGLLRDDAYKLVQRTLRKRGRGGASGNASRRTPTSPRCCRQRNWPTASTTAPASAICRQFSIGWASSAHIAAPVLARILDTGETLTKKARIYVTLKPTLLDAQGRVVQQALTNIGFDGVENVRMGKYIEVDLSDASATEDNVREMCSKLLANPVIEDFRFEVEGA